MVRRWGSLLALGVVVAVGLAFWLADARVASLLRNTLWLVLGTWAIALPLGTLLALLLVKTDLPGRRAAAVVLGALLLVPLYLQAAAWQAGFGLQGWYTLAFETPPLLESWRGAIWVHALAAVPWVTLIVGVGLAAVEPELEEEALLDALPGQVFLRVTLRRALAAMGIAALWIAIGVAGEITVANLFQINTLADEVYTSLHLGEGSAAALFSASTLLTLALALVGGAACWKLSPRGVTLSWRQPRRWSLGKANWLAALLVASLVVLLVTVPLGSLAYKAGVVVEQAGSQRVRAWSAAKLAAIVAQSPARFSAELAWSHLIALCAATAALLLGLLLTWHTRRHRAAGAWTLAVTAAALAVPGPVLGILVIGLLNQGDSPLLLWLYDRSILAPWLVQTTKALPVATLLLWHALATLPREPLESAASEGAGALTQLMRIVLPSRWPALLAAWGAGFIVAMGELAATILVTPPGMTTLPVRIFGLIHYGVEDQVAGICLTLIALLVVGALGFCRLGNLLYRDRDGTGR